MSDKMQPSFREAIRSSAVSSFPHVDELGERAPECWDSAWKCAEALYRYSTCADECPGPQADHTVRMLVGRITNEGLAALDCLERGNYDLSLIACRVMYEQHNLLTVLLSDDSLMQVFKASDSSNLMQKLRPRSVRKRLHELGAEDALVLAINDLQVELNQRVMHPALEQLAAAHTPGRVVVGPAWQPGGFLLGINEVAFALGATLARLILTDNWPREVGVPAADALAALKSGLGGLRANRLPDSLRQELPPHRWMK